MSSSDHDAFGWPPLPITHDANDVLCTSLGWFHMFSHTESQESEKNLIRFFPDSSCCVGSERRQVDMCMLPSKPSPWEEFYGA